MRMAIFKDGAVYDIAEWDGSFTWVPVSQYPPVDITNRTDVEIGTLYDGTTFSIPTPVHIPLNQQYTPQQYGQLLISQLTTLNTQRGLTPEQILTMANNFGGYFILLQTGALASFLEMIGSISVDGTIITTGLVTYFQNAIGAYLGGQ